MRSIRAMCVLGVGLVVSGCCEDERALNYYGDLAEDYEGEEAEMLRLAGLIYQTLDCDDDGLSNAEEDAFGSSMYSADTDSDGLLDIEEQALGTNPDSADSDGDGFTDFEEVEAGTDPTRASSSPGDINRPVTCDRVTEVEEQEHFAEAAFSDVSSKYYRTYDFTRGGPECMCTVELEGTSKVTGISVFMPTSPLEDTNWGNLPIPRGVWVETPWGDGVDVDFGSDKPINQSSGVGSSKQWHAFYVDPTKSDVAAQEEAVDLGGDYTIFVSTTNVSDAGSPPFLEEGECDLMSGQLQFRVDYNEAVEMEMKLHDWSAGDGVSIPVFADGRAEDAIACTAGERRTTRFALADLSSRLVPIAVSGASDYAYSKIAQVRVIDWNGAENLSLTDGAGTEVELSVEEDWITLPDGGVSLEDAQWSDDGDSTGASRPPVVDVVHVCPTRRTGTAEEVDVSYPLSWDTLEDAVSTLTAGWASLSMILPERTADLPALLVRPPMSTSSASSDESGIYGTSPTLDVTPVPATAELLIESHGIGPVLRLDAEEVGSGVWTVSYDEGLLSLSGYVAETEEGLVVQVEEGWLWGIPLMPVELRLSTYGAAE
ncbi:MAG: hypothetical protein AAFV53_15160 [Myxococcota bacterium]